MYNRQNRHEERVSRSDHCLNRVARRLSTGCIRLATTSVPTEGLGARESARRATNGCLSVVIVQPAPYMSEASWDALFDRDDEKYRKRYKKYESDRPAPKSSFSTLLVHENCTMPCPTCDAQAYRKGWPTMKTYFNIFSSLHQD